ncbi:MAG: ABC transporter substrate-binding protein [Defluviitaleaceae bacterium]|nr:ABC transporter substrate-binding protein [Defluviitaleaceae bacterium]
MNRKFFCYAVFFIFLFLTSCGGGERISPSGLPYVAVDYEAKENEPEPECEEETETETETEPVPTTEQTIPDDGVLRLHMRPPMTLNPLLNEDVTVARILRLIFEPLAVLDNEFRVTGHLACLDFASDFSSVNATVREGAIWSDGKPVTSEDIIFSIEFLRAAPSAAIYSASVREIESAVRIDSRTVQIKFNRASVMAGYSLNFPVIPRHYYENQRSPQSSENMNPVGSGPFVFESLTPMRSMTLNRNPYYSRGRARIEEAEIIFLPNIETDFHAFERGRTDVIHLPLTEWTRHHGVRSPVYEIIPAMYFEFIGFNYRNTIFRDIYTRQGIAHAFNADEAVSGLYLAHAVRSVTPIHPYNYAASASVVGPVYDPARAAALLGTVRTDEPLIILANAENKQRVSIAERLAESLTRAGLPANAEIVTTDEYFERINTHDFDLFIGGMELPFAPDVRIFFEAGEMFLHDPILEAAYSVLMFASTEAAYTQATTRLQQAFAEQLPVIGLAFKHSALLTSPRITGNLSPVPDHVFINAYEWDIR